MTVAKPASRPTVPHFSSGPCAKRPGWNPQNLKDAALGRSHRAKLGKAKLKLLYPDEMPLLEKVRTIAKELYRAKDIAADKAVRDQLANF